MLRFHFERFENNCSCILPPAFQTYLQNVHHGFHHYNALQEHGVFNIITLVIAIMNPVHTLQQPFRVPGASSWGSAAGAGREGNNNTPGGRAGERPVSGGRPGASFVLQSQHDNHSIGGPAWSESAARAVKRAKSNAGGLVYRDGESTGYEEDGSEAPSVDDWVAIHKPTSRDSSALRDHSNIAGVAATSISSTSKINGPGFVGLNPKRNDAAASASVACTRYFQVSL